MKKDKRFGRRPGAWLRGTCPICTTEFEYRRSKPKTFCSKKCANADPGVLDKMRASQQKTWEENGGHPMNRNECRDKFTTTMNERYGVNHALHNESLLAKSRRTCQSNHGVDYFTQSDGFHAKSLEIKKQKYGGGNNWTKIRKTMQDRYGVDWYPQSEAFRGQMRAHYANNPRARKKYKIRLFNRLTSYSHVNPLFDEKDFTGVSIENKYPFECTHCHETFESHLDSGRVPRCYICNPVDRTSDGSAENELFEFVRSLIPDDIIYRNNRDHIPPKELDILIPNRNIAIEYNGLYWHAENVGGKGKTYHLDKTNTCLDQDIFLYHIFETEWLGKRPIVESILRNATGNTPYRLYARKGEVRVISTQDARMFLETSHIQGYAPARCKLGLFIADRLVSVMTFGKSRFGTGEWELIRFANLLNTSVVGAFGKLFKHFTRANPDITEMVTFADRRYFTGEVYLHAGFVFETFTRPSYYYVKGGELFNRMQFQKHKLPGKLTSFNPDLTEWENMQLAGYDRIWDCGNARYRWTRECYLS